MWKSFIASVLLIAVGCARSVRDEPLPPVEPLKTGRCGEKLGASPFKNPQAIHFLVADFHGAPSAGSEANFSETVSTQVTRALEVFKEEVLRNPQEFDIEIPEGSLEIERLACFLENHEQAEAAARELDADVVIWGQAFCNVMSPVVVNNQSTTSVGDISAGSNSVNRIGNMEVNAGKPYTVCPKATLYRSERSFRRGSERGVDLASLGHLDLPTLRSTEPFLLVQFALGLHFYELGNYWLAARFFEKSAEKVVLKERSAAELKLALGLAYLHLPNLELSLRYSREALESDVGRDSHLESALISNIGRALHAQGDYGGALEHYRRALEIDEKALGKDHPTVAIGVNNIGYALHDQGDYAGALEHLRRALAINETALGKDHLSVATNVNNIGLVLQRQGDYEGALEHYRRALAIAEKALGKDHPTVAIGVNNIGHALHDQCDYGGALEHYRRALAIDEKVLGKDHPTVATRLNNIGQALQRQGDYGGALDHYRRALAIAEKALGKDHRTVATLLNNIGHALHDQGDYAGALEHLRRVLAIAEKALGKDHPFMANLLNNIGSALQGQGDHAGALEYYRRALVIAEKALGKDHPTTRAIRSKLEPVQLQ